MAINYIEKGPGLHSSVGAAGHQLSQVDGVWVSSNDVAVQAIIDAYNPLPDLKAKKVDFLVAQGMVLVQQVMPGIQTFDQLDLVKEQYLSLLTAARAPTARFQKLIDIYTVGETAINQVKAATTQAQVDAVNPVWPSV